MSDKFDDIARDIMDDACLSEAWVKNGTDAALRKSIAQAIRMAVEEERESICEAMESRAVGLQRMGGYVRISEAGGLISAAQFIRSHSQS